MLKVGEKIVAAVSNRDHIVVFGDQGTVLRMVWDGYQQHYILHREMEIATR